MKIKRPEDLLEGVLKNEARQAKKIAQKIADLIGKLEIPSTDPGLIIGEFSIGALFIEDYLRGVEVFNSAQTYYEAEIDKRSGVLSVKIRYWSELSKK